MINRFLLKSYKVRTSEKIQKMFGLDFKPYVYKSRKEALTKLMHLKRVNLFSVEINNRKVFFVIDDREYWKTKILLQDENVNFEHMVSKIN